MSAPKKANPHKKTGAKKRPSRAHRFTLSYPRDVEVLHEGNAVDATEIVPPLHNRPAKAARKR